MIEKNIETKLREETKKRGGMALKLVSPGFNGMPDRMVLFPGGVIAFVETKAPGKKPRKIQEIRHEMLRRYGFKVYVPDTIERVMEVLDEIQSS